MCGIVGLLDPDRRFAPNVLGQIVGRMADTLRHRGPDSGGAWIDGEARLAVDPGEAQGVDLVQRPELALRVPPAMGELAELRELSRIGVRGRVIHARNDSGRPR